MKAVLKKVIRDVTARASADDQDDLQVGPDKDVRFTIASTTIAFLLIIS